MRDTENKTKENSVRGLELTAEKINSYSAAEGAKALADLKKQSIHAMEENEAFLMKLLQKNMILLLLKPSKNIRKDFRLLSMTIMLDM